MPKPCLKQGMLRLLSSENYHPVAWIEDLGEDVVRDYIATCTFTGDEMRDRGLKSALLSDLESDAGKGVWQQLQVNLKTHKPDGKVVYRAIHSSAKSVFKPGMRYVSWCLRGAVSSIPWLLRDSFDLAERMLRRTFLPNSIFNSLGYS